MPISVGADIGAFSISLAKRSTPGGDISFVEFPLANTLRLREELLKYQGQIIPSVGSGSWKLALMIEKETGALVEKHREPICIWAAIEHLLNSPNEAYKFVYPDETSRLYPVSAPLRGLEALQSYRVSVSLDELKDKFPLLLVNVKSGTSFYRIDSPTDFVRVGGSSIGAATVSGIGRLLAEDPSTIDVFSSSPILDLAATVNEPSSADLLVEDIYGGDCASIGLPGSIIASSVGKASGTTKKSHIAKSVLDMAAMNTAQLTSLHAQLNGCSTAIVVGAIGYGDSQMWVAECMQRVVNIVEARLFPKKPLEVVFFENSRFLGCLGALLRREQLARDLRTPESQPFDTSTMDECVSDEVNTKLRSSVVFERPQD